MARLRYEATEMIVFTQFNHIDSLTTSNDNSMNWMLSAIPIMSEDRASPSIQHTRLMFS